ncbi:MAG: helix-turn-helix transcriptional regulator [Opitutales bacterium]|nr:helix-turn-helix transcriptional regulator [Opitutales bacterium]
MQTLGEKLAEARMKKGISIQEASEKTKIRVSFLEAFEQNNFEIDLPDIYKKGFIKNYADLLDLNTDEAATDYARESGGSFRSNRKTETRDNLGKIELGSSSAGTTKEPSNAPIENSNATPQAESLGFRKLKEPRRSQSDSSGEKGDKMLLAAVGVSVAAVLLVVGFLVWIFGPDKKTDNQMADNSQAPKESQSPTVGEPGVTGGPGPTTAASTTQTETLGLEARGGDVKVILMDKATGNKIFDRTILDGEAVSVPKTGPLTILFTDGDKVYVRLKGKLFKMPKSGAGRSLIP